MVFKNNESVATKILSYRASGVPVLTHANEFVEDKIDGKAEVPRGLVGVETAGAIKSKSIDNGEV